MNLKFRNVLVTGGAGYVGAVLVPKLLDQGYHVTVLDWFLYGENPDHANLTKIKGDLRDHKTVAKTLQNIDAVIHLACISNDPSFELNPELSRTINFDATKNLVDAAISSGVKRFIFASSSSVYGVKQELKVTEDLPLEPLTDYSKYKALSEKYILTKQSPDFTVLILRPATVCGYSPRMRLDLTVNILTIQALVNKKITVYGGSQARPNIHISDMTDLYVRTLEYPDGKIQGKIYNAGYENYTVLEIANMVKQELHDREISISIEPTNDLRSYRIDSGKIRRELGFTPQYTVSSAIGDIARAYKQGLLPNPTDNPVYYNIRTMKSVSL
jgi:nucleoside-diphosphate-sugar epimerase